MKIRYVNKPREIAGKTVNRWFIDGDNSQFWPTEEAAREWAKENACPECGDLDCNGECMGE